MGAFPDEQVIQHHSININGLISLDAFKSQLFPLRSNVETTSIFLKLCGAQKLCTEANGVKEQFGRGTSDFSFEATVSSTSRQQRQIDEFQQLIGSTSSTDPVPKSVASTLLRQEDGSHSADTLTDESSTRSGASQSPSKPKRQKKSGSKDKGDKGGSPRLKSSRDSKS